ncbi:MAG: coproporphyrinogen dehydrogenase HemZ [Acidaminococcaceae bacterium]|nr:coproporphyrinogen dehydrogenase HemZ [Acidaminococcaceae bacterium]
MILMDKLKIALFADELPVAINKTLTDLLLQCQMEAVPGTDSVNGCTGGELYLTASPAGRAFLLCVRLYVTATGESYQREINIVHDAPRGEWARTAKITILSVLQQAFVLPELPWGILTGVRPGKLAYNIFKNGGNPEQVLVEKYLVAAKQALLLNNIVNLQNRLLRNDKKEVAVYVSVPYCPSRCLYCSFPSGIMPDNQEFQQNFCTAIEDDIRSVVQLLSIYDLKVGSVYVGGGTPTSLSALYFHKLLGIIAESLKLTAGIEFTVEAGRPDTITQEKLQTMSAFGVNRVTLNPQTFSEKTLSITGRKHTVQQIYDAYNLIRKAGFKSVNMDMIIGLPGENSQTIKQSFEKLLDFAPENLTVHMLSLKKQSLLFNISNSYDFLSAKDAASALSYAEDAAEALGMNPYYLYRQHYMLGNHANIGYSLPGHECLYNMQMMEERHTVIGIGPLSATKVPLGDGHSLCKFHMPGNFADYRQKANSLFVKRQKALAFLYE